MELLMGMMFYTMISAESSLSQVRTTSYLCDASVGCANDLVETDQITTSAGSPDITTSLPLSIVPSDVMGSLVGPSIPTILITDTGSVNDPASTQWHSPSTSSISMASLSLSTTTITTTGQATGEETALPITTQTITYPTQSSPTANGGITLSIIASTSSASASAPANSSEQSAASIRSNALCGVNLLSIGILISWRIASMAAWM